MRHVGVPLGGRERIHSYHVGTKIFDVHEPIHGGAMIMNGDYISPDPLDLGATLGCIVNGGGKAYMLSNSHVMYYGKLSGQPEFYKAGVGPQTPDPIVSPPRGFPGSKIVGHIKPHTYYTPGAARLPVPETELAKLGPKVGPFFDATLATIEVPYTYDIPGIGITTGHIEPEVGMEFIYRPALRVTTNTGKIINTDAHVYRNLTYTNSSQTYGAILRNNLIQFTTTQPILNGDSGSALIEPNSKKV